MAAPSLLVADDDSATRELVKLVARDAGWAGEILEAASGVCAVILATEAPVVAAVLDIEMPMLDGVMAAEAIWNYCQELPIIFYTSVTPPAPIRERAEVIGKGRLEDLAAALKALRAKDLGRPPCDRTDAVVLQALLAAQDDVPLMIVDPLGEFKFANYAASLLYDLPYPARGTRFHQHNVLNPTGGPRDADTLPFARALATGLPVHDDVRLRQRDGSIVDARVTGVPHRAVNGEITSVSLCTDHVSLRSS